MDDHEMILRIQELLDGQMWAADTLEEIASLLVDNGYRIRDLNDKDVETTD